MSYNKRKRTILIIENDDEERSVEVKNEDSYYKRNKELLKEKYAEKAEKARAYQIEYNLINNDKYSAYQKNYYCQKKEKILESKKEKVTCECGKLISLGHMTVHKKTAIHLKKMNSKV